MLYEKVFRMLAERKIRYVVAGGVAVVLHGVGRATGDLDLIVHLERTNLIKFIEGMENLGFVPRVPVKAIEFSDPAKRKSWIRDKGMKVFSFYLPNDMRNLVDVFVEEPLDFDELYEGRKQMEIEGIPIQVISRKHLKQLKRLSGRPLDFADVESLETLEELEKDDSK